MNDSKENLMKNLKIPLARPWFDEEEVKAASEVVNSKWLIFGKQTEEFEKEFAQMVGAKYAIAVNSGSSALLVSLMVLGIKEGDEVIVPNMTFVSTASAAMFLGAVPVFADLELKTYCIDPLNIEKRITERTKAIIPVHYAGQTADMDPILDIAKKHNLRILEDAAEAHLSEYKGKKCGTIGDIGIFSFTPSKPMTTGEGGMIVTNDEELARKIRLVKNFGDTDKFKWDSLGFNFRMPEVMGAIGRVQLKKLPKAIEMRRNIASKYNEGLKNEEAIILPYVRNFSDHNFQLYTIRLNLDLLAISRDEFIGKLAEKGVSSRLYYPTLHNQKVFEKFRELNNDTYPNSVEYAKTALSLPIYPELTNDEINYVIESIKDIIKNHKREKANEIDPPAFVIKTNFAPKKVLITGGGGFIGTYVARNLLAKGLEVKLFDLDFTNQELASKNQGNSLDVERIQGSILDSNALCNAMRGCDYVIHLAAMLGVRRTELKRIDCLNINILGTINVLEACLKEKVQKVLFTSSSEVYGEMTQSPIKEDFPKNPVSIYAITKLAGEEFMRAYWEKYGLKYSIVRFFNVYGPGQVAEFVMPRFIKRVLTDKPPVIYGDGSQIRSFCFVADAAEGLARALLDTNGDNQIVNIGNNKEPITMKELAEKVIKVSGKNLQPEFIPMSESDRHSSREIMARIPCIDRACNLLKYEPAVSLEKGIKEIMDGNFITETWFENL